MLSLVFTVDTRTQQVSGRLSDPQTWNGVKTLTANLHFNFFSARYFGQQRLWSLPVIHTAIEAEVWLLLVGEGQCVEDMPMLLLRCQSGTFPQSDSLFDTRANMTLLTRRPCTLQMVLSASTSNRTGLKSLHGPHIGYSVRFLELGRKFIVRHHGPVLIQKSKELTFTRPKVGLACQRRTAADVYSLKQTKHLKRKRFNSYNNPCYLLKILQYSNENNKSVRRANSNFNTVKHCYRCRKALHCRMWCDEEKFKRIK